MTKTYNNILDEIEAQMKQMGHISKRATFKDDTIKFGLQDFSSQFKTSDAVLESLNSTPVSGSKKLPGAANDKDFKDENKQVKLRPSSTIQSAAYWPTKEYLVVSFKSGHTYSYEGVPIQTVLIWEWSSSAGSFFYHNIRMNYKYQKLG